MTKMFFWKGGLIGVQVERVGNKSTRLAAEKILKRANEHVPYREGRLESSGKVTMDGGKAAISYDTVYAARLHQHPEYNFQGKGEGRWLLNAIEASDVQHDVLQEMAKPYRDALGRFAVRP